MQTPHRQKGLALLMLVFVLALVAIAYAVHALDATNIQNERNKKTAIALAEAKTALLGSVLGVVDASLPVSLPNPDSASALSEGIESGNLGATDATVIGKLPWRDLGIDPLKDGWGECIWYIASGRYKRNPPSALTFNWDKQGQINVIDISGNVIGSNLVALIVAPGPALDGQNRALSNANYKQCGGNYDAKNYLDPFVSSNAISGEVNYFAGSTDNRQASNDSNKTFVLANNDFYNDKFVFITVDDIFDTLIKRNDFVVKLNDELNNAEIAFVGVSASGSKGTDNINCGGDSFCENWEEMLLLVQFPSPTQVTIDGTTETCNGALIFGGKSADGQSRITDADKDNPANYIEGSNLGAFNNTGDFFNGASTFNGNNPTADVIKCL